MLAQQIVVEIIDHIQANQGLAKDWYVGISADPRVRLFSNHCVRENGDTWIYREALSHKDARLIEDYLLTKYGFKGGTGGGGDDCRFIYAYKIGSHTVE